jgi:hypothetical protein
MIAEFFQRVNLVCYRHILLGLLLISQITWGGPILLAAPPRDLPAVPKSKPALIPLPRELRWGTGSFGFTKAAKVFVDDISFDDVAEYLRKDLSGKGFRLRIVHTPAGENAMIVLRRLTNYASFPRDSGAIAEGYQLSVTKRKIILSAFTPHGIFNGLQTLRQLTDDTGKVPVCEIRDWPAFSWRGYMVDVGRNYQSMALLKEQVKTMARYKLNIFHFHATEDIAWRFESKMYPQLTAPENMLRNPGKFYSEKELKELIAFCKERFITLIPEIDMPGHSAAFRRAMGTDMQTEEGTRLVKNILNEFLDTYKIPYLHVGGDEVKIKNYNFLPEVIKLVRGRGVSTIGWSPGGNLDSQTIRQLWAEGAGGMKNAGFKLLDSRHLYLNHMDPFEGVTTLFNRQILNLNAGDSLHLGAILCNWPDRRVAHERDAIRMNLVFPGMLSFAERTWRGGGIPGWQANIGRPGEQRTKNFFEFEGRLLEHKDRYFKNRSFPYVTQRRMDWKLFGPFDNGGNLANKFEPEKDANYAGKSKPYKEIMGATVVLRHWWAPLIAGALDSVARENITWYATTRIWSSQAGMKDFWIGFNNFSRSYATDSPPAGAWDTRQSGVRVNGTWIAPPDWTRAGEKGNSEVPLTDEGYEYRAPTKIYLRKGWNDVLIKAPVGSFKGKDWQNPVKWMFTFVPVSNN